MRALSLRRISKKARKRADEARPIRAALLAEHRECQICGASPRRPHRGLPLGCSALAVHEIADGPSRQACLDKRFGCLVVCWACNSGCLKDALAWPESKQLAVLKRDRPQDFDLAAYNMLVNPRAKDRITVAEVDGWKDSVC